MKVYQILNEFGNPASVDGNDLALFRSEKEAVEGLHYLEELDIDVDKYGIHTVDLIKTSKDYIYIRSERGVDKYKIDIVDDEEEQESKQNIQENMHDIWE